MGFRILEYWAHVIDNNMMKRHTTLPERKYSCTPWGLSITPGSLYPVQFGQSRYWHVQGIVV